jgi:PPOX class probable F420-dependent enzyme
MVATQTQPPTFSYDDAMAALPGSIRTFLATGPIAHVVTLNQHGDPDVSVAWVGIEDDEIVIGTLSDQRKLRNLRTDPRIAMSFQAPGRDAYGLDRYLVLRGRARVTEGGAPEVLQRLARTYLGPDVTFPPMPDPPPGFVIRMVVEKVSGNGSWTE